MKKSNLLSKSEMKKVKGGVPAWSATCTDPVTGSSVCYDRMALCQQYCWSGWVCTQNTGSIGCN